MTTKKEFIESYIKIGGTEDEAIKVYDILNGPTEDFLYAMILWALEFSDYQRTKATEV